MFGFFEGRSKGSSKKTIEQAYKDNNRITNNEEAGRVMGEIMVDSTKDGSSKENQEKVLTQGCKVIEELKRENQEIREGSRKAE